MAFLIKHLQEHSHRAFAYFAFVIENRGSSDWSHPITSLLIPRMTSPRPSQTGNSTPTGAVVTAIPEESKATLSPGSSFPSAAAAASAPIMEQPVEAPATSLTTVRTTWRRLWSPGSGLEGESIFLFLLTTRWLALVPPALSLLRSMLWPIRDASLLTPASLLASMPVSGLACGLFLAALSSTLLLSWFHPRLNIWLTRRPFLLGLDMALMTAILTFSGGTASPYYFFAVSPLLASAFFFQIRGGLIAALCFTPLYLIAAVLSANRLGWPFDVVEAQAEIAGIFGIAIIMGYPSLLLQRLRVTTKELQHTQETLARAETQAAMGRMIAHVSHEIRNPLTTLGGYAHHLMRKPDDTAAVRNHAKIIASEVLRLEELLNDLLDLSRPRRVTMVPANLHDSLDRACVLAGNDLQSAKITLKKEYDNSLPRISQNASALLRAWLNIARNAAQAMPDGGTLSIATSRESTDKGDCAVVRFSDTGRGIAPEILPTIWTPFVTHRDGGTGLGLAVTLQIIHDHGGTIQVESEVGRGTTFTIRLPIPSAPLESDNLSHADQSTLEVGA